MRKSILGIFLLLAVAVMAGQRTPEQAAEIAAQFTNQQPQLRRMHASERQAANLQLAHKALQNNSQDAAFYVFNQENNNGFVIISADDRTAEDVLGYTDKGSFDADHINPNLAFWLSRYTEEITGLQTLNEDELANIRKARKATKVTAIAPLLKNAAGKEITWYQEAPYYNYCPIDKLDNTRSLTGCVATATSAVMYKWRHPAKGHGTHSYTWYDWKDVNYNNYWTIPMSANFDTVTFKWDDMLPAYIGKNATPAQKNAVASLMFNVGVAANMQYGGDKIGGSGAWTDDMAYALQTYFDYTFDKFITMYSKSKYESQNVKGSSVPNISAEFSVTKDQITTYFNADLEAGRPIVMGGEGSAGGHEFVCDGRDTDNKFHINFGWEGDGNGYYTLSALGPSGAQFSSNLDAIIGLRPATTPVDPFDVTWMSNGELFTTTSSTGAVVLPTTNPTACEGKVFVGWTATANYSSATTAPTFVKAGDAVEEGAIFYAVFATQEGQGTAEVTDVLTGATTGVTGNQYASWSGKTVTSSAVYAGQSAGSYNSIQLRSNNNNSGVVTTASGGKITKVSVVWNSNTAADRKLDVYGKNSAYTDPSDLYDNSTKGTKLGTIQNGTSTELTVNGDYTFVGVRSNNGALYLDQLTFTWSGSSATYKDYSTTCGGGTDVENTVVAPKAVKVIENGQVVILREGAKYNVLGQPIQ